MKTVNTQIRYFTADGRPTIQGVELFNTLARTIDDMTARLADAEGKLAAIAALSDATGGATIDAEARAVIAQILDASA